MTKCNRLENVPFVSIVIPTLNRKNDLRDCLNSLRNLDYPKSLYEIIVVDNGSSDGTKELVGCEFREVKLIMEQRRGTSFARNAGVRYSIGSIIAFIDDDCLADRSWLRNMVRNFFSEDIIGVGGPVHARLRSSEVHRKLIVWPDATFDRGEHRQYVTHLSAANASFKRKAFQYASFDPELGPPQRYLEDFDFCKTLRDLGFKIVYDPKIIVYHNINLARATFRFFLRRPLSEGISSYYYQRKRRPWIKVFIRFVVDGFERTFKFLRHRNSLNFYRMMESFSCIAASIWAFNLSRMVRSRC